MHGILFPNGWWPAWLSGPEDGSLGRLFPIPVSGYDESCLADTKCPVMQPLSNTGTHDARFDRIRFEFSYPPYLAPYYLLATSSRSQFASTSRGDCNYMGSASVPLASVLLVVATFLQSSGVVGALSTGAAERAISDLPVYAGPRL